MHKREKVIWSAAFLALLLAVCVVPLPLPVGNGEGTYPSTAIGYLARAVRTSVDRFGGDGVRTRTQDKARNGKSRDARKEDGSDPTLARVKGYVRDEAGKPLADAKITVRSRDRRTETPGTTEKNGSFKVEKLVPGTYDVIAAHEKHVAMIRPNVNLRHEGAVAEILFQLPLGATIKGQVVDEEGQPVTGATITARRHTMEASASGGGILVDNSLYRSHSTKADGHFAVEGVALGPHIFEVRCAGYSPIDKEMNIRADKAGDPLKFTLKRDGRIAGTVCDIWGRPVQGAEVVLVRYKPFAAAARKLPRDKNASKTRDDGTFHFRRLFNEGSYDVLVEHPEYAPSQFPLVAAGTENATFRITRGGGISGTTEFVDRDTTPAAVLVRAETVIRGTTVTREISSDGAGNFRLQLLPPGAYRVWVASAGFHCEMKRDVKVAQGQPVTGLKLEVYQASTARGRVLDAQDEKPISGAKVVVNSTVLRTGQRRTFEVASGAAGEFDLSELPAGVHEMKVEARGFVKRPTALSAQTFRLQPGERKSDITLRLDRGGTVEGFVVDAAGRTIPEAHVQLYPALPDHSGRPWKDFRAKTDSTGYFRIWGLDVGERLQMVASARREGFAKSRSPIFELTAGKPGADLRLTLEPGGTIRGKVTDADFLPIHKAEVRVTTLEFGGDPSESSQRFHTNPDGTFSARSIPVGRARVEVSRSGYVSKGREVRIDENGAERTSDFQLAAGHRIAGRVLDTNGDPIPGATVRAHPIEGSEGSDSAPTNKTGFFRLGNLGQGHFRLEAEFVRKVNDFDQRYVFRVARVRSGSEDVRIECDLHNGAQGRVESEASKGLETFRIALRSHANQGFTFNMDKNFDRASGVLDLLQVPKGQYNLTVSAEGYEPAELKDVRIGPLTQTKLPRLRLKSAGGIEGEIYSATTGRPVNDALVRVVSMDFDPATKQRRTYTARSNYAGAYRQTSIPPGLYEITFEHPSYMPQKQNQVAVLQKRMSDLGRVDLEAGGVIIGSVSDSQGRPVPDVEVFISGSLPPRRTKTDAAGNFLLQGIRTGNWPLVAKGSLNGRRIYKYQILGVVADDTKEAKFVFDTMANLEGALFASGRSASGQVRIHPFDEHARVIEDIHYTAPVEDSRFRMESLPTGNFFLWAKGSTAVSRFSQWRRIDLHAGANRFQPDAGIAQLRGTVQGPDASAEAGTKLRLTPQITSVRLPRGVADQLVVSAASDALGRYTFDALMPGAYNFEAVEAGDTSGQWKLLPTQTLTPGQILTLPPIQLSPSRTTAPPTAQYHAPAPGTPAPRTVERPQPLGY